MADSAEEEGLPPELYKRLYDRTFTGQGSHKVLDESFLSPAPSSFRRSVIPRAQLKDHASSPQTSRVAHDWIAEIGIFGIDIDIFLRVSKENPPAVMKSLLRIINEALPPKRKLTHTWRIVKGKGKWPDRFQPNLKVDYISAQHGYIIVRVLTTLSPPWSRLIYLPMPPSLSLHLSDSRRKATAPSRHSSRGAASASGQSAACGPMMSSHRSSRRSGTKSSASSAATLTARCLRALPVTASLRDATAQLPVTRSAT